MYDSREEMGRGAAMEAAAYLRDLLVRKEEVYIVFAAAPSQNDFLSELIMAPGIAWERIHALHMDEYIGFPADAPQGFGNFLKRKIFDKLPFASVHYIGTEKTPEQACADYEKLIRKHAIDIVFMGIGENGHIAFNDPHVTDFSDPQCIKKVDLDIVCRRQQVNDGCFTCLEEVPQYALTLTIPTLFSADRIFCIVPASTKAQAVRATVYGEVSERCPASILREHDYATLYIDTDSGADI